MCVNDRITKGKHNINPHMNLHYFFARRIIHRPCAHRVELFQFADKSSKFDYFRVALNPPIGEIKLGLA
jgi:hypothetical protein